MEHSNFFLNVDLDSKQKQNHKNIVVDKGVLDESGNLVGAIFVENLNMSGGLTQAKIILITDKDNLGDYLHKTFGHYGALTKSLDKILKAVPDDCGWNFWLTDFSRNALPLSSLPSVQLSEIGEW